MIVKKIARKSQGTFHQLTQYILREERKNPEIGRVRISNCNMNETELAVKEIEATQARNTRSKADKTCHLIVSFPTGETPTTAQCEDIEDELCGAIGLGDHQRLSVIHLDTEHVHIHIAINKIHPVSHHNIELIRDHFKLAEACERLEERHQLTRDNHPQRFADHQRSAGVGEMAAHGDRVPFHDWALTHKQALGEALSVAATWDDLHRALARKGMVIKPRGAGLVLADKEAKAFVKASALGREFSAAKLTARFGAYQDPTPDIQNLPAQVRYTPTRNHNLWADYQRERQQIVADKRTALDAITEQRALESDAIKAEMADKRAQVFNSVLLTKQQKRALYLSLSAQRKTRYAELSEHTAQARQAARTEHPVPNWRAWLRARTDQGDRAAERALERTMRRDAKHPKQANRKRTAHQALASEPPPTQDSEAQWEDYQALASEPTPTQDSEAQWENYQDLASEPPPTQGNDAQWDAEPALEKSMHRDAKKNSQRSRKREGSQHGHAL